MCGRLFGTKDAHYEKVLLKFNLCRNFLNYLNIAPSENIPVIHANSNGYDIRDMRFGLHPSWSNEPPNNKFATFNAKIETVETLPSFRGPIKKRRGVIPIDGFVEWKLEAGIKQPYYIQAQDGPLLLAAVWDVWQDNIFSCAVVTQPASKEFCAIHDRMPLSLTTEQAEDWMNLRNHPSKLLNELTGHSVPLSYRHASPAISNARNKLDSEFYFVSPATNI